MIQPIHPSLISWCQTMNLLGQVSGARVGLNPIALANPDDSKPS